MVGSPRRWRSSPTSLLKQGTCLAEFWKSPRADFTVSLGSSFLCLTTLVGDRSFPRSQSEFPVATCDLSLLLLLYISKNTLPSPSPYLLIRHGQHNEMLPLPSFSQAEWIQPLLVCSSPLMTFMAIHQFVNLSLVLEGPKWVTRVKEKESTTFFFTCYVFTQSNLG